MTLSGGWSVFYTATLIPEFFFPCNFLIPEFFFPFFNYTIFFICKVFLPFLKLVNFILLNGNFPQIVLFYGERNQGKAKVSKQLRRKGETETRKTSFSRTRKI